MSESQIQKYRRQKAELQKFRCFYCGFPMWTADLDQFARSYDISAAEARRFFCTAEHLKALGEGGTSRFDNLVCACQFCNQGRHRRRKRLEADVFLSLVQRRITQQRWHPSWLHKMRAAEVQPSPSH